MSLPPSALAPRLLKARRILALCGAGLSAPSGLATFRGAGGLWRGREAASLATPEAFAADPGAVWSFYAWRRRAALRARPNEGHRALAALAAREGLDFLCLTQNVDGLHARAGHDPASLRLLHGSLFDLRCGAGCGWVQRGNYDDPVFPALGAEAEVEVGRAEPVVDSDQELLTGDIPPCPACGKGLQRPGVVWFGEGLDEGMLGEVEAWIGRGEVDVVLVVGTSAVVWPAAGYVELARGRGTSVVHVNMDVNGVRPKKGRDFVFQGDAAELLPTLLEPLIGRLDGEGAARVDG